MALLINMRVFKTIFTVLITTSLVQAGPASFLRLEHRTDDDSLLLPIDTSDSTESSTTSSQDSYDQRQNGTENYRVHVDGFVVVVAPVEALLLADTITGGNNDFLAGLAGASKPQKPEELKPTEKPDEKPDSSKPDALLNKTATRPHLRLVSFLTPILRRITQH